MKTWHTSFQTWHLVRDDSLRPGLQFYACFNTPKGGIVGGTIKESVTAPRPVCEECYEWAFPSGK